MRRNLLLLAGVTILVPLLSQTAINTPSAQSAGGDRPGGAGGTKKRHGKKDSCQFVHAAIVRNEKADSSCFAHLRYTIYD